MTKDVQVHVGETLDAMGRRFVDAWQRAEAGELTAESSEQHLSFEDFATFQRVTTPKRLALLRDLHATPAPSVRALARRLGRDYRRVHDDVEALGAAGLIKRSPQGLYAGYDRVRIETTIAL